MIEELRIFFRTNRKWLTLDEIADKLGINKKQMSCAIYRMRYRSEVENEIKGGNRVFRGLK